MKRYNLILTVVLVLLLVALFACRKTTTTEVTIDRTACNGCGRCLQVCPVDAIELDSDGKAVIDQTLCIQDGKCIKICPQNAPY